MTTSPDPASPSPIPPTPSSPAAEPVRRKGGRWWKILLGLVVVLLLLVLLAPTILSTGMGKSILLGQINGRVPGKVTADSLSVGWFSGANVRKFEMTDPQGKSIVSLDADTGITLWSLLTGSTVDLKDVNITGKTPQLPGCTVKVKLLGTADLGRKLIDITGDSVITALDDQTQKGTVITIASGSKLSYGDLPNDANITVDYVLEQIQKIGQNSLPEGTVLGGQRRVPLHITGALTKEEGTKALRGIKIDKTGIGWDLVNLIPQGLLMGKADVQFHMEGGVLYITPSNVPLNGGVLQVLGRVDFNTTPPAFIIDKRPPGNPVVRSIALNKQITANWLNFLPIQWGAQPGMLAEVGGQANVQITEAYIPLDAEAFKSKGTVVGSVHIVNLTAEAPFLKEVTKGLGPVLKMAGPDLLTIRGGSIPEIPFALRDGKVGYQNLRLGTRDASLTFSGSVGLDKSLAMNMEVSARNITLPIPVGLTGTTEKPQVVVDLKALGNPENLGKTLEKAAPGLIDQFMKKRKD
jgi:hypothetical protein